MVPPKHGVVEFLRFLKRWSGRHVALFGTFIVAGPALLLAGCTPIARQPTQTASSTTSKTREAKTVRSPASEAVTVPRELPAQTSASAPATDPPLTLAPAPKDTHSARESPADAMFRELDANRARKQAIFDKATKDTAREVSKAFKDTARGVSKAAEDTARAKESLSDSEPTLSERGYFDGSRGGIKTDTLMSTSRLMSRAPVSGSTRVPTAEELSRGISMVKLHYATDRRWTGSTSQPKWFGSDWNAAEGHLTYGTCDVSIPVRKHTPGEVRKPSILRLESDLEIPEKHVVVYTPQRLARAAFFDGLAKEVRQRDQKEVIIFIHGFNNTFDDAASRLGVLAYDMEFGGIPVLYSWSSKGGFWGALHYVRDEDIITSTNRPLTEFLDTIAQTARDAGARRLSIVAHSMGNRPLVAAMQALAARANRKVFFDEVVMAAPDVRGEGFATDEWPLMHGTVSPAKRVTLYASSNDKALLASKKAHGFWRIGEGGQGLMVLRGLDTIDATGSDFSKLGLNHTYFGGPRVVADLSALVRKGLAPGQRNLSPVNRGVLLYWLIPPLKAR